MVSNVVSIKAKQQLKVLGKIPKNSVLKPLKTPKKLQSKLRIKPKLQQVKLGKKPKI